MKFEVPINVDIDDVTKLIHDLQCLQTYKLGADDTMVLVSLDDVADVFADHIRAKRLDKDINVPSKSALDHIHNVVRDDAYKCGYEQGKTDAAPVVNANDNTFMIDVSEEDFDKIKRVIVGCGPMCRVFYEEGGEAHWIKRYTPDDGEIYECDNCGVTWQFNGGGPEENEAYYCPKCGFKMVPNEGEKHGQN